MTNEEIQELIESTSKETSRDLQKERRVARLLRVINSKASPIAKERARRALKKIK